MLLQIMQLFVQGLHIIKRPKLVSHCYFILHQSWIFLLPLLTLWTWSCSHQTEALPLSLIEINFTFLEFGTSWKSKILSTWLSQSMNSSWFELPWNLGNSILTFDSHFGYPLGGPGTCLGISPLGWPIGLLIIVSRMITPVSSHFLSQGSKLPP